MEEFNKQFGVAPASPDSAYIPLATHEVLEEILVKKETRIISKNLSISYENRILQIIPTGRTKGRSLVHLQIEVRQDIQGKITLWHKGRILDHEVVSTTHTGHVVDSKRLNEVVDHLNPQTAKEYNALIEGEPWLLFTPKPIHQPLFATT